MVIKLLGPNVFVQSRPLLRQSSESNSLKTIRQKPSFLCNSMLLLLLLSLFFVPATENHYRLKEPRSAFARAATNSIWLPPLRLKIAISFLGNFLVGLAKEKQRIVFHNQMQHHRPAPHAERLTRWLAGARMVISGASGSRGAIAVVVDEATTT